MHTGNVYNAGAEVRRETKSLYIYIWYSMGYSVED